MALRRLWISGTGRVRSDLHPSEHPTNLDVAWAAGIYEGEGSVHASTIGQNSVSVAQKERWLCDRLRLLFGGSVHSYIYDGRTYYRWGVSGALARGFLMTIYCFLSPHRRTQIRFALRRS